MADPTTTPLVERLRAQAVRHRENATGIASAELLEEAADEIERLRKDEGKIRRAPVQGFAAGIPWEMHLRAYDAYSKKWAPQKALIEGGCRGGFSVGELDRFIPGWREELLEISRLRALLARALEALSDAAEGGEVAANLVANIRQHGNYSEESMITFLGQIPMVCTCRQIMAEIEKEIGNG